MGAAALVRVLRDRSFSFFWSNRFFYLSVALVGNFMIGRKRIFGGLKAYLQRSQTIPLAILLVEIISRDLFLPVSFKSASSRQFVYFFLAGQC
jgi:hypothetical protein